MPALADVAAADNVAVTRPPEGGEAVPTGRGPAASGRRTAAGMGNYFFPSGAHA